MAVRDDVRTSSVALVGLIGAIALFAIIVGLQVLYYNFQQRQHYVKDVLATPAEVAALVSRHQAILNSYAVVDPQKKKVAIPISRAMELTEREISADPEKACPWGVVVAQPAPPAGLPATTPPAKTPAAKSGQEKKW